MGKYYITGTLLCFLQNYCAVVTKKYWALEKEEILNLTSCLVFGNYVIRGTYSKYFQNNIYETGISSAAQQSTT